MQISFNMSKHSGLFFFTVFIGILLTGCQHFDQQLSGDTSNQRNVILIIGDGMDNQQITMARNYLFKQPNSLALDSLPVRSSLQVLTSTDDPEKKPVYVADSANSATSIATGKVTSIGRISTSAAEDQDLDTIAELAKAQGYSVGLVSTSSVTDATMAAFATHSVHRNCENSEDMIDKPQCQKDRKPNGLGSIAEQLARSNFDVILGGGYKHFMIDANGLPAYEIAKKNNFEILTDQEGLNISTTIDKKILGLFSSSHLPVRLQGTEGRIAEAIDTTNPLLPTSFSCESNVDYPGTPTLEQLADKTLDHLSKNTKGFFLMIESASIDKQSHNRNPCGSIGELQQLDETLEAALDFVKKSPQTLVLVTADHGHAAQIVDDHNLFSAEENPIYTPGHLARLQTADNSIMAINYATSVGSWDKHTGVDVPLYANKHVKGITSITKQPELFNVMADYLNIEH